MKNILTTFLLIFAAFTANATLLLEENFNYTVGDTLGIRANVHGKWSRIVGALNKGEITIANENLTYTGYAGSGVGKSVLMPGVNFNTESGYGANYPFTTAISNGSVYAAMLINITETFDNGGNGNLFCMFDAANAGTGRRGTVFAKTSSSGKYRLGLTRTTGASASTIWSSEEYLIGQTALIILKYTLDGVNGNNNDSVYLYINPSAGSSESNLTPLAAKDGSSDAAIKSFSLKILKYNPTVKIGGLRIATTWEEAVSWADATPPILVSTLPANNATEVALNTPNLTLTFNEAVKIAAGATSSTLSNGGSSDAVNASNFVVSGSSISIPVTENFLQESNTYTFMLPANSVSDISGNAYTSAISFSFTTKSTASLSSENAITAFKIPNQVGTSIIRNDSVFINVPFGTNLTKLRPDTVGLSANARLKSGTSQATDSVSFVQTKKYVVEAENGSVRNWFVKVITLPNNQADITAFIFTNGIVSINSADTTIRVRLADLSDLTRKPQISISANASITDTTLSYNFTNVITYVVTAEDGLTQKRWRVIASDYGVAALPVSYKGSTSKSWQNITANGWLSSGLRDDAQDGTSGRYPAGFNTVGDFVLLRFDKAAEKVTFKARSGSSGVAHKFLVEQSANGTTWTTLKEYVDEMYASSSSYNSYSLSLKLDTRYIRWTYTEKAASGGTNIYMDEVAVNVRPLKATFTPANSAQNVAANAEVKIDFEAPITSINGVAVTNNLNNVKLTRVDNSQQVSTTNTLSADRKMLTLAHSGLASAKEYTISINGTVVADGGISGTFENITFKIASTADDVKKDITSFSIAGQTGNAVIDAANKSIAVPVIENCQVKTATKDVTHNGASCELIWTKGSNRCPIYYRCTANDGSYVDWKIVFSFSNDGVIKSQEANITAFSIPNQVEATANPTTRTVVVTMPYGTNVTALVPSITLSNGADVSPASGVAQNFTNAVTYTVTAEDEAIQAAWTISVIVQTTPPTLSNECSIRSFKIGSYNGIIKDDTIRVRNLPAETDLSALLPSILISDKATISPSAEEMQDFRMPFTYTVTAEDGVSKKTYVVVATKKDATGIENELYKQLNIYPNPVADALYISLPQTVTNVEVYNMQGVLVKQTNSSQINVSHLPQGNYIIKLYVENGITLSQKITIKK